MNYITNRERQEIGFRQFLKTHIKETRENRDLKSTIKLYAMFVLGISILIAFENYRGFGITLGVLILAVIIGYNIVMFISQKRSKKITLPSNIEKVEHVFGDAYENKIYFIDGSVNESKYEYSDIFKIVEGEEFYYIYINPFTALPLDKQSINNLETFISFVKGKGVLLKGL